MSALANQAMRRTKRLSVKLNHSISMWYENCIIANGQVYSFSLSLHDSPEIEGFTVASSRASMTNISVNVWDFESDFEKLFLCSVFVDFHITAVKAYLG